VRDASHVIQEGLMLKIIAIVLVVLVVAILGLAMTKPDSFSVQRKTSIQAPPDKIFPLIDDFHNWSSWSPWEKLDPAMNRTHSGAASGKGAVYEWDGNSKVGKGRMEITQVSSPSAVVIKLDFLKPFEGHNIAEFTLEPQGDSTNVTWVMRGPTPFVSKVMQVFISMDKMIGKDFDSGLANLKTIAEK
jgi:Polyketide cyclase / dehydrase and lipid transport